MFTKRMFALLLVLCVLLTSVNALAAPTRDTQAMEVTLDEKLLSLTELMVNAAILQGTPAEPDSVLKFDNLDKDAVPSDLLVSCVLAWGIQSGILPHEAKASDDDKTISLTPAEARLLLEKVFTNTGYQIQRLGTKEAEAVRIDNKYRTWYALGKLNVSLVSQCNYGVHIYSAGFDGTNVTLLCDVFSCKDADFRQSAERIPEEALEWRYNAGISLRSAPDSYFGYTLNSFSFSPAYQDGDFTKWTEYSNTELEYTVNLPSILSVADDTANHRVWRAADGKTELIIEGQEGASSFEDAMAKYLMAHPGAKIRQEREFDRFIVTGNGSYTMVIASEALPRVYTVTLTFPAERQAEYELYAEIIRNSMSVWGLSNG